MTVRSFAFSAIIFLSVSSGAQAQLVQVAGGSSSLMGAHGGTIQINTGARSVSFGLGWHDGFRIGLSMETPFAGGKLDIGDRSVPFVLPTDLFDSSYYFWGRGVGLRWEEQDSGIFLFGGATSQGLNTPFLNGAISEDPVGVFFYHHSFGRRLVFSSFNLFSGKATAIQALQWTPLRDLSLAISGGVGYQEPYGAASVRFHRDNLDVLASYTLTNTRFRRVRLVSPLTSETDGANLRVDYRPWSVAGLSFSHQNLFAPATDGSSLHASVDGLSGWATEARFRMSASVFRSDSPFGPSQAFIGSVERPLSTMFDIRVDYFRSRTPSTPVYTGVDSDFHEKLNSHLSLSQALFTGGGQRTFSFGGGFSSNAIDFDVDYQTIFVPLVLASQPPFRRALVLSFRCKLWKDVELHATTNYTPLGQTRYTAYATGEAYPDGTELISARRSARAAIPNYVITGRVQDEDGQPVFGAALIIGRQEVFTNSDGIFVLRRKRPGECDLKVDLAKFLFPQQFEVVSAPSRIHTAAEGTSQLVVIALRRILPSAPATGNLHQKQGIFMK